MLNPVLVFPIHLLTTTSRAPLSNRRTSPHQGFLAAFRVLRLLSANCDMSLPDVHCDVCGGPFDNPHGKLVEGRYPDTRPVDHITSEKPEVCKIGAPRTKAVLSHQQWFIEL